MGLWDKWNAGNVVSSASASTTTTATASLAAPTAPPGSAVIQTNYLTGFEVSATSVASTSTVIATVTGVIGGTLTYVIAQPFVAVEFSVPLQASASGTAITISANFGNTATVAIHGIVQ